VETKVIEILTNEEDGFEVHIAEHVKGFSVTLFDTDAEEFVGFVKIYPKLEDAKAFAKTLI
jgi:hypothetical protein